MSQHPLENQFESKENDFVDAIKAFGLATGFFMGIGVLAIIAEIVIMVVK